MSSLAQSTISTTDMLLDSHIALCRGIPTLPAPPALPPYPEAPEPSFEQGSEWIENYRALALRFERRRDASRPPESELYAICADRVASVARYMSTLEARDPAPCWSEMRPFLRFTSRQDSEMGADGKYYLFADAQKLWTLDALLQEEEGERVQRQVTSGRSEVLLQWKSTSAIYSGYIWTDVGYRCYSEDECAMFGAGSDVQGRGVSLRCTTAGDGYI